MSPTQIPDKYGGPIGGSDNIDEAVVLIGQAWKRQFGSDDAIFRGYSENTQTLSQLKARHAELQKVADDNMAPWAQSFGSAVAASKTEDLMKVAYIKRSQMLREMHSRLRESAPGIFDAKTEAKIQKWHRDNAKPPEMPYIGKQ